MAAELSHHRVAVGLRVLVHRGAHIAQMAPGLHGLQALFHGFLGHAHQVGGFGRYLADAEHAGGIGEVAVQDGGAVHVHDVALGEHLVGARNAVAHHFVDGGAHAFREAFVVEWRGDGAVLDGVVVHPHIDLLGGHAGPDALGHVIERAHVHGSRALHALDVGGGLQQIAARHVLAGLEEPFQALVEVEVALLVFLAAAAPAFVVAAGARQSIVHDASPCMFAEENCSAPMVLQVFLAPLPRSVRRASGPSRRSRCQERGRADRARG